MGKEGAVIVDTSKISGYLRQMRLKSGLTQLNVAEKLNITPQAVSKWERRESMPDITLLPELAKMYGITVEDILTAGEEGNFTDVMQALNTFVDENIFERVRREFEKAKSVQELSIPMDIFMALNSRQKDVLLELLLDMDGCGAVIDDILQYLNISQRARLIRRVAESGDYETLEMLIPFMTRTVRTETVALLLERGEFEFLEEMLLFLNREQKELIVSYFVDNGLDFNALESFLPFLDREQRERLSCEE